MELNGSIDKKHISTIDILGPGSLVSSQEQILGLEEVSNLREVGEEIHSVQLALSGLCGRETNAPVLPSRALRAACIIAFGTPQPALVYFV